jgi:hypothetical protein
LSATSAGLRLPSDYKSGPRPGLGPTRTTMRQAIRAARTEQSSLRGIVLQSMFGAAGNGNGSWEHSATEVGAVRQFRAMTRAPRIGVTLFRLLITFRCGVDPANGLPRGNPQPPRKLVDHQCTCGPSTMSSPSVAHRIHWNSV